MLIMFRIESTVSPELDHGLVHKDGELGHRRESSTQSTTRGTGRRTGMSFVERAA